MASESIEGFRLSPQQRSLWRHVQSGGSGPYRAQLAVLVQGAPEAVPAPDALRAALERAVDRHEILRTHFHRLPGVKLPVQVIADRGEVRLTVVDGTGTTDGPGLVEAQLAALDAGELATDRSVLEAIWIDYGGAGALLLGLPPGLVDRIGLELLAAEVLSDCGGALEVAAEDDEGPLQYADLAEWQNELLEGDDGREGLAAWRRAKPPARPPVDLPIAGAAEAGAYAPAVHDVGLSEPEAAALLRAAEGTDGADIQHLVLAAWLVLLWRRSGQEERLIGVGFEGRAYEELQTAIGLFERELPVSIDLRAEESCAGLAQRVAACLEELGERQETFAWDKLIEAQGPEGDGGEPALPIGFGFDDHRTEHTPFEGLSARVLRRRARTQPSLLRASLVLSPSTVTIELHRDAARLGAADAERIGDELKSLIGQLCASLDRPVAELDPLGGDAARTAAALAPGLGAEAPDYPRDTTIHALIEAHALRTPEATAVICGEARLSYGELDRRANALARTLRAAGAGPDRRIALFCGRSADMFVGLLGILKSGAGYVPIDPGYPADRVAFLIGDADCPVIVTSSELLGRLPGDARIVTLDGQHDSDAGPLEPLAQPNDLAYVIYTSGSTGRPKGVEVPHRNLVHSTEARRSFYGRDPETYLLVSSYAFDSSVAGIFWTLCSGGTLVLPEEGRERDVVELARLIATEGVRTTLALPSLWNLLLDLGGVERLAGLATVVVAGEACTRDLAAKHRELLGGCQLVNEYGPTEGTVWCTAFDCAELGEGGPVPIGAPIARTSAYLLDEHRRPVPLGAPGELWIGGEGIARGYLDRDELTAERFVPDPFLRAADGQGSQAGTGESVPRMYRTGDLARWLPSGALEFLGRVDHQVKIRGYRVELGEVEDALCAHPGVAEAVAMAREDTPGDQRLVVYAKPSGAEAPAANALLEHLRERLPDYMIPQAFVALKEIPRTPNGKVDRRALPAPEASRSALSAEYVEPSNALERAFCEVWAEALDVPRVGVADDFFELGGHSILAVRLVAQLGETFGLEVGLRQLFDAPTVSGLLAALAAEPKTSAALAQAAEMLAQVEALSEDELDAALGDDA